VLLRETVDILDPKPNEVFVDGTCGSGGHAEAILERTKGTCFVIGIDKDPEAIERTKQRLARFAGNVTLVHGGYENLRALVAQTGRVNVNGVLLDLGFSLEQISDPQRGFSFLEDGPLDMRYDPTMSVTAARVINTATAREIEEIFETYGEIRHARKIARAMVERRKHRPFVTTHDLAEFICAFIPRRGNIHPATLFFQALRIYVNNEMDSLARGLEGACETLAPKGKLAVISFHSLEDRMVKHFLRNRNDMLPLMKKPVVPSREELLTNPRARSAKLRAGEKQ